MCAAARMLKASQAWTSVIAFWKSSTRSYFCRHSFVFFKYIFINCMMNAHLNVILKCYLMQCYLCFFVNPFQLFMHLLHDWVLAESF